MTEEKKTQYFHLTFCKASMLFNKSITLLTKGRG